MTQNRGSDFSLTEDSRIAAVFTCDGDVVSFYFRVGERQFGPPVVLSRAEAVEVGKRVAETGIYDNSPIPELGVNQVKHFGERLRQYGEKGC